MLHMKSFMAKVLHVSNFEWQNKIYKANAKFDPGLLVNILFLHTLNKYFLSEHKNGLALVVFFR